MTFLERITGRARQARIAQTHAQMAMQALQQMRDNARLPGRDFQAVAAMSEFVQQTKMAARYAVLAVWPIRRRVQLFIRKVRTWRQG